MFAGLAGRGLLGLGAEEILQPAEETAGLLLGRRFERRGRLGRTNFALRTGLALGTAFAFGATAFLETARAIAAIPFGTAFATLVAERTVALAGTTFATLEAAFAVFAAAFPAMLGGLARGRREDVELGHLGRSLMRHGGEGRNRRRGLGGGRLRHGSGFDGRSDGSRGSGDLGLGSRGRSGLGCGGDRSGRRRGDGNGSRRSGLGLGRTKTTDITRQRDHGDRRGPVDRSGGGLRRGSGDGLAFAAREAGTATGSEGRNRRRDRGGFDNLRRGGRSRSLGGRSGGRGHGGLAAGRARLGSLVFFC